MFRITFYIPRDRKNCSESSNRAKVVCLYYAGEGLAITKGIFKKEIPPPKAVFQHTCYITSSLSFVFMITFYIPRDRKNCSESSNRAKVVCLYYAGEGLAITKGILKKEIPPPKAVFQHIHYIYPICLLCSGQLFTSLTGLLLCS